MTDKPAVSETASLAAPAAPIRVTLLLSTIGRGGGGVSEAARLLALGLARRTDIALEVVTLDVPGTEEARPDWPEVPIRAHAVQGPVRFGASFGMLVDLMRRDPGVVHLHGLWMFPALAAYLAARLRGAPVVITPHGMLEPWILARTARLKRLIGALYQNALLRRAALVQALTRKELGDIAACVSGARTRVIPNFVPAQLNLPEGQRPAWWRPEMKGRRVYLFFGRIHDKKGWRELCAAWDALCRRDAGFCARAQLVFCGWLDDVPAFEARVADLAARHGNVTYGGPAFGAEKTAAFAAADLFILPSKSEGLPMAVLEAWAAGLEVLMTEACNLPEAFEAGAALRIGESAEAVAEGIVACEALPEAGRRALVEAGQALLTQRFSEAAVVGALAEEFRAIAQARRGSR